MDQSRSGIFKTTTGRSVGWLDRGAPDGTAVLWFHGQPGSCLEQLILPDRVLDRHGLRIVSIDRAGWGDTDPAGLDRANTISDAFAVLDHLGIERVVTLGASMGGTFALASAALEPARVSRVVLVSANVLPYDDESVVADLSQGEQDDVALLRSGDEAAINAEYAASRASLVADVVNAFDGVIRASFSKREQRFWSQPDVQQIIDREMKHGLAPGHAGYRDDGLRTVRELDFDLAVVACPVRAIHGTEDSLEPISNVRRLVARLADAQLFAIDGVNHFGPWIWPDTVASLIVGEG